MCRGRIAANVLSADRARTDPKLCSAIFRMRILNARRSIPAADLLSPHRNEQKRGCQVKLSSRTEQIPRFRGIEEFLSMERTDRGGRLLHQRMNNDPVILTLSFYMTRCLSRHVVANEKLRERNRGGGAAKIAGVCHGMRYKTFPSRGGRKFENLGQT